MLKKCIYLIRKIVYLNVKIVYLKVKEKYYPHQFPQHTSDVTAGLYLGSYSSIFNNLQP